MDNSFDNDSTTYRSYVIDDTWDRVVNKYVSAWTSECWQNSKHERVCRGDNNCKFDVTCMMKFIDGE